MANDGANAIRILILTNLYPPHHIGGYELRCQSVVDRLRRRGHQVHVLTSRYGARAAQDPEAFVTRALHVHWGPPYPPEDLPGLLRCESADREAVRAALLAFEPDVVDVWGMEFASQSLVDELLQSGVPAHLTVEDVWLADGYVRDPLCAITHLARQLDVIPSAGVARLCRLGLTRPGLGAAYVSFASRALADRYREAGFDPPTSRVRVAGIDLSPYRDLQAGSEPPPFVILNTGQLTASRGQRDLIEAAARVADDTDCAWPLLVRIVGGGDAEYVAKLTRLAGRLESERLRVEIIGPVAPDRVPAYYADAHLFVHASHLPEGLPRALMEALAAGVPAIATDTGGQRDILDDGRWGALVSPSDPDGLADAIRDVMRSLSDCRVRARAARQHAHECFDIEAYVNGHERDLNDAAEGGGSASSVLDADAPTSGELAGFTESLGNAAEERAAPFNAATDPDGAWRLGVLLKRTGRLDAAEDLLACLRETHGDDPPHARRTSFHLAELAMVRGDWQRAGVLLKDCLSVAPDHAKAAFDLRHVDERQLPDHLSALCARVNALQR